MTFDALEVKVFANISWYKASNLQYLFTLQH